MLNTIQDIERYNVTNRLERNAPVGSNVIHLRSTPAQLVGATLTFEPGTVREESHVATAVSEHQVTLGTNLAYLHELDTPVVRLDLISLAQNGEYNLAGNVSIGGTSVTVNYVPGWVVVGSYVVIDPYTIECEVRKITSIAGTALGLSALTYAHASGDPVIYTDTDIINAFWFGAKGNGVANDAPALAAAITEVRNKTDARQLYIPAGTYILGTVGVNDFPAGYGNSAILLNNEGCGVVGAGMGRTVLKTPAGWTYTDHWSVIKLNSPYQYVKDLTINLEGMAAGPDKYSHPISVGQWNDYVYCHHCLIKNVEITNLNAHNGGGTAAISVSQSWWVRDVVTTLASEVASPGSQTVTLAGTSRVYRGKRFIIGTGGTKEEVIATGGAETTLTATFANTHSIGEAVESYTQGRVFNTVEDCYIHDCPRANGIVIASSGNTVRNTKIINGGSAATQHAIYLQGGYNTIDDVHMEGWESYHIHGYFSVPHMDVSGNKIINCLSINPGYKHLLFSEAFDDGTNAEIHSAYLNRHQLVQNCTFRNTNGYQQEGIDLGSGPVVFDGNTVEDIYPGGGGGVVTCALGYWATTYGMGKITNNTFIFDCDPLGTVNGYAILAVGDYGTIVEGNTILIDTQNAQGLTAINGNGIIANNLIRILGDGTGISIADNAKVYNNRVICSKHGGGSGSPVCIGAIGTNVHIINNYFETSYYVLNLSLALVTGVIEGNEFVGTLRYNALNLSGLIFRNNKISPSAGGSYAMTWDSRAKHLQVMENSSNVDYGRFVKLSGITVAQLLTTDVDFFGVNPTSVGGTGFQILVAYEIGSIVVMKCSGAWTAGNIGVPCTTTAGMVMDSASATPPVAGSYVLFMDTGGGAGDATVMILKTI